MRIIKNMTSLVAGFILCLVACQKSADILPGNGQDTYLNFYNASEVLQQNLAFSNNNLVIINDTVPGTKTLNQMRFSSTDDFRQYPRTVSGAELVNDPIGLPLGTTYDVIYWKPIEAGSYRFIYTSLNKVYLKDTTIVVSPKSFTTQYLVESSIADDAYRILTVPEERKGTQGKVRIKVINLSPDFGSLEVYRADQNGNQIPAGLPTALRYGQNSSYAEIDTVGTAKTRGQLLLKFRKSGSDAVVLTRAVDAISNSSFVVVFQGFEKAANRRIKTGNQAVETVKVSPNLRVNVRRVF